MAHFTAQRIRGETRSAYLLTDRNRKTRMNREIKKIAKWAQSQGWTLEDDASGHTRFYNPDDSYVTDYPATPSRPKRRMADLQVKLRKEGLQVPPPSKKERRAKRADATEERDNDQQDREETDDE
jgi:hypothetical protein